MKTSEEIAQWVIDNRFSKSEKEKVSDFEMYNEILSHLEKQKEMLELCLAVYNSFGGGNVITFSDSDIEKYNKLFNNL